MELVSLEGGRVLTFHQWMRLEQGYLVYRAASTQLGALSLERGKPRWRQRPKGHWAIPLNTKFMIFTLNPRYTANYLDEDFVRRSKRIAIKSDARFVSQHVIQRYAVAACLRWTKMVPEWQVKKQFWRAVGQPGLWFKLWWSSFWSSWQHCRIRTCGYIFEFLLMI